MQPGQIIKVLTIDGGEATGTSSSAKAVSLELRIPFLDSGALYRTFAYYVHLHGIDPAESQIVETLARTIIPQIRVIGGLACFEGRHMGDEIRTPEIGRIVPFVAKVPVVRKLLAPAQHSAVTDAGLVAEGRDMGTTIFPDALLKVFLIARPEVRAKRRHADFVAKKIDISEEKVLLDILERDRIDSERTASPMKPAADAIRIDTSDLSLRTVIQIIVDTWKNRVS